mgnify:CR=1 FL=1
MPDERATRIATLRERVKIAEAGREPTFDVPFRGQRESFRKIRIRADFPLYRIQSGRTHKAQSEYLDQHPELPRDFFDDPEDPAVQNAQHELLLHVISQMKLDEDLDERGQQAPLILTCDGTVVDGNRRLAALREDRQEYVMGVVLPEDATAAEIYETEVELQMQRETRAPYDWVDQALHIEFGIEQLGQTEATVAKRMRLSPEEVRVQIEKLKLVREYLEWIGEPRKYHKVPGGAAGGAMEQVFEDMRDRLNSSGLKRKPEAERLMIRRACFAAIKAEAGYKQVRSLIKHLSQQPDKLLRRLGDSVPSRDSVSSPVPAPTPASEASGASDDPLSALMELEPTKLNPSIERLNDIVKTSQAAGAVGKALLEVAEELDLEEKDAKRAQVPLKRVQHAVDDLEEVELTADMEDLDAIARALDEVFSHAERLRREIERIQAEKEKT